MPMPACKRIPGFRLAQVVGSSRAAEPSDVLSEPHASSAAEARLAEVPDLAHADAPRPMSAESFRLKYRYAPDAVSDGAPMMPYSDASGTATVKASHAVAAQTARAADTSTSEQPGSPDHRAESPHAYGDSPHRAPRTSVDLRKLNRSQLLSLLRDAVAENERLHAELDEAHRQLDERRIVLEDSESLAEAALRLSGTLDGARTAAALYGENVNAPRGRHAASAQVPDGGFAASSVRESRPSSRNGIAAPVSPDLVDTSDGAVFGAVEAARMSAGEAEESHSDVRDTAGANAGAAAKTGGVLEARSWRSWLSSLGPDMEPAPPVRPKRSEGADL